MSVLASPPGPRLTRILIGHIQAVFVYSIGGGGKGRGDLVVSFRDLRSYSVLVWAAGIPFILFVALNLGDR